MEDVEWEKQVEILDCAVFTLVEMIWKKQTSSETAVQVEDKHGFLIEREMLQVNQGRCWYDSDLDPKLTNWSEQISDRAHGMVLHALFTKHDLWGKVNQRF